MGLALEGSDERNVSGEDIGIHPNIATFALPIRRIEVIVPTRLGICTRAGVPPRISNQKLATAGGGMASLSDDQRDVGMAGG